MQLRFDATILVDYCFPLAHIVLLVLNSDSLKAFKAGRAPIRSLYALSVGNCAINPGLRISWTSNKSNKL